MGVAGGGSVLTSKRLRSPPLNHIFFWSACYSNFKNDIKIYLGVIGWVCLEGGNVLTSKRLRSPPQNHIYTWSACYSDFKNDIKIYPGVIGWVWLERGNVLTSKRLRSPPLNHIYIWSAYVIVILKMILKFTLGSLGGCGWRGQCANF